MTSNKAINLCLPDVSGDDDDENHGKETLGFEIKCVRTGKSWWCEAGMERNVHRSIAECVGLEGSRGIRKVALGDHCCVPEDATFQESGIREGACVSLALPLRFQIKCVHTETSWTCEAELDENVHKSIAECLGLGDVFDINKVTMGDAHCISEDATFEDGIPEGSCMCVDFVWPQCTGGCGKSARIIAPRLGTHDVPGGLLCEGCRSAGVCTSECLEYCRGCAYAPGSIRHYIKVVQQQMKQELHAARHENVLCAKQKKKEWKKGSKHKQGRPNRRGNKKGNHGYMH